MPSRKVKVAPLPCSIEEFDWAIRENLIYLLADNAVTNELESARRHSIRFVCKYARQNYPGVFEPKVEG